MYSHNNNIQSLPINTTNNFNNNETRQLLDERTFYPQNTQDSVTFPEVTYETEMLASGINVVDGIRLRSIQEIPSPYNEIFSSYPYFNVIQSQILNDILYTDNPIVISAPTGSGKTVLLELAIVKHLMAVENTPYQKLYKIVYIAPMKAVCEERLVDWHQKFSKFGLNCISVTGDSDDVNLQSLLNHNLIISTPEKWDSLTRKWKDNQQLVQVVKLFMLDEIHLLNEESRGPTVEAVVSRMKTVQDLVMFNARNGNVEVPLKMRFLALSATVPNIEDIAEWIGKPEGNAKYFKFSEDLRPVKLKKVVLSYQYEPRKSSPFKFDIMLNYKLQPILLQYAEGKPTLIFCSTRKSVEMTTKHLVQNLTINLNVQQKKILQDALVMITDNKISNVLIHGVAYHHGGMLPEDRRTVENLFRNGDLPILVTTSTLAMGVNLPAHLVIIKSTKVYIAGEYTDYDETRILQMIGRAGRPQFDTSATAVILTTQSDKHKYETMVCGTKPIESNLHRHLTEHLNAEVVLRTITDIGVAMQWLCTTFLHIRAKKHPRHYNLPLGLTPSQLDQKLLDMCHIEINKLGKVGMLTVDHNISIVPTNTGILMAKYYLAFDTMKLITQVTGKEILQQLLALISKCSEFSEMYLRVNEKKCLNLLNYCRNGETIRFPLNGKIKTSDMKINCIIQAVFGCLDIPETSIIAESTKILRSGERIAKCIAEYLESKSNCFSALLNSLILAKCFHSRLWEDSYHVCKQFARIGITISSMLVAAGKTSFKAILESNPRDLERIINKKSPMGNTIQEQAKHLPQYKFAIEMKEIGNDYTITLKIILVNVEDMEQQSTVDCNSIMNLLVGDSLNDVLLYEKYTHSYMIENPLVTKHLNISDVKESRKIFFHFISDDWVGFDCKTKVTLKEEEIYFQPETKDKIVPNVLPDTKQKAKKTVQQYMDMYMQKTKTPKLVKSTSTSKISKIPLKNSEQSNFDKRVKENESQIQNPNTSSAINKNQFSTNCSNSNGTEKNLFLNCISKLYTNMNQKKNNEICDKQNNTEDTSVLINKNKNEENSASLNLDSDSEDFELFANNFEDDLLVNNLTKASTVEKNNLENNQANNNFIDSNIHVQFMEHDKQKNSKSKIENQTACGLVNERKIIESSEVYNDNPQGNKNSIFDLSFKKRPLNDETGNLFQSIDNTKENLGCLSNKRLRTNAASMTVKEVNNKSNDTFIRENLHQFKFKKSKKLNSYEVDLEKPKYKIVEMLCPEKKEIFDEGQNEIVNSKVSEQLNRTIISTNDEKKSTDSCRKSIKWRSPLISNSPICKFSPNIDKSDENSSTNTSVNDSIERDGNNLSKLLNTSTTSCKNQKRLQHQLQLIRNKQFSSFPITDKQFYQLNSSSDSLEYLSSSLYNQEKIQSDVFDICSTSFKENMGLLKNKPETISSEKQLTQQKLQYSPKLSGKPVNSALYYSNLLSQHDKEKKKQIEIINTPIKLFNFEEKLCEDSISTNMFSVYKPNLEKTKENLEFPDNFKKENIFTIPNKKMKNKSILNMTIAEDHFRNEKKQKLPKQNHFFPQSFSKTSTIKKPTEQNDWKNCSFSPKKIPSSFPSNLRQTKLNNTFTLPNSDYGQSYRFKNNTPQLEANYYFGDSSLRQYRNMNNEHVNNSLPMENFGEIQNASVETAYPYVQSSSFTRNLQSYEDKRIFQKKRFLNIDATYRPNLNEIFTTESKNSCYNAPLRHNFSQCSNSFDNPPFNYNRNPQMVSVDKHTYQNNMYNENYIRPMQNYCSQSPYFLNTSNSMELKYPQNNYLESFPQEDFSIGFQQNYGQGINPQLLHNQLPNLPQQNYLSYCHNNLNAIDNSNEFRQQLNYPSNPLEEHFLKIKEQNEKKRQLMGKRLVINNFLQSVGNNDEQCNLVETKNDLEATDHSSIVTVNDSYESQEY